MKTYKEIFKTKFKQSKLIYVVMFSYRTTPINPVIAGAYFDEEIAKLRVKDIEEDKVLISWVKSSALILFND